MESDEQFDKADMILSKALEDFIAAGVSQEVYGMALLEIGVLALVRLGETEDRITGLVRDFIARTGPGVVPVPRGGATDA